MTLTELQAALRLELKDTAVLWSNDELTRCVTEAVADLSRFLPLEKVYEETINYTVTAEAWIAGANYTTWVALANSPIEYGSEVVKDDAAATCTRDTDYKMDYSNGKIIHLTGGKIAHLEACTISYSKSRLAINISSLTDLFRVVSVEYPVGDTPQTFTSFELVANWLYLLTAHESQQKLTDKKHIAVKYQATHTVPTADVAGSYPVSLDEVVMKGASSYACFMKALQQEHQAVTDLTAVGTTITAITTTTLHALTTKALKVSADLTDADGKIDAALNKVAKYLETDGGVAETDNARAILADITDNATQLRDAIQIAVAAIATELGYVGTKSLDKATSGAEAFMDTGYPLINTVTVGDRVSENYREYSEARVAIASARINKAMAYVQEAATRLSNLRSYIEEAGGWMRMGEDFIAEAVQRIATAAVGINEAGGRLAQLDRYLATAAQYESKANAAMALADRWRTEAIERRSEFWSILRDRTEIQREQSITSRRQPK